MAQYEYSSIDEAMVSLREHEIKTEAQYVVTKRTKLFNKTYVPTLLDLKKSRIRYSGSCIIGPLKPHKAFIVVGCLQLSCIHGKPRSGEMLKQPVDHQYKMERKKIQPSKKLGCASLIKIQEVLAFDGYKAATKKTRDTTSQKLKTSDAMPNLTRLFIMCHTNEHSNHITGKVAGLNRKTSKGIVGKIHDIVSSGASRVPEVRAQLEKHVDSLPLANKPSLLNRQYYPSNKTIYNHIQVALSSNRYSDEEQTNVRLHLEKLALEFPGLKYSFTPHSESSGQKFLVVLQCEWQRKLVSKFGQAVLVDSTFNTTKFQLPLFEVVIRTNVGYSPVAIFICEDETEAIIEQGFRILLSWNMGWDPLMIMTDNDAAQILALKNVFPGSAIQLCQFHREQAWKRWLSRSDNCLKREQDEILTHLRAIANSLTQEQFEENLTNLKTSELWKRNKHLQNYLTNTWLNIAERWVRSFRPLDENIEITTTNGVEVHHRLLKNLLKDNNARTAQSLIDVIVTKYLPNCVKRQVNNLKYHVRFDHLGTTTNMVREIPHLSKISDQMTVDQNNGALNESVASENPQMVYEIPHLSKISDQMTVNQNNGALNESVASENPQMVHEIPHLSKISDQMTVDQNNGALDESVASENPQMVYEIPHLSKISDQMTVNQNNGALNESVASENSQMVREIPHLSKISDQVSVNRPSGDLNESVEDAEMSDISLPDLVATEDVEMSNKNQVVTKDVELSDSDSDLPAFSEIMSCHTPTGSRPNGNDYASRNLKSEDPIIPDVEEIWSYHTESSSLMTLIGLYKLYGYSFATMKSGNRIGDEIINAYIQALVDQYHQNETGFIDCIVMSNLLDKPNSCSLMKKMSFDCYAKILCPFNSGGHWALIVIFPKLMQVLYLDPLGELNNTSERLLKSWRTFVNRRFAAGLEVHGPSMWKLAQAPSHSKQQDSVSCGIFVMKFAELLLQGKELKFPTRPYDMSRMRKEMAAILLGNCGNVTNCCRECGLGYRQSEDWIQCSSCYWWHHFMCSGITRTVSDAGHGSYYFLCNTCQGRDNRHADTLLEEELHGIFPESERQQGTRDGLFGPSTSTPIKPSLNVRDSPVQPSPSSTVTAKTSTAIAQPSTSTTQPIEPYVICNLNNQIKICAGCRSKFSKPVTVPNDLVIRHRELDSFFDKQRGQMRTVFQNKYYHVSANCLKARNPGFLLTSICLPPNVNISDHHLAYFKSFGVDLRMFVGRQL